MTTYQNASRARTSVRVVGVEDGGFSTVAPPGLRSGWALLVAVLMHTYWIDAITVGKITVDGTDATDQLMKILEPLSFDAVMLGGISFAGFNLVDPERIYETFNVPIIVVSRKKPSNLAMKRALVHHFKDWRARWKIIKGLGEIHEVTTMPGELPVYIEISGGGFLWSKGLACDLAVCCRVPEPVRVAKLVARGLTRLS